MRDKLRPYYQELQEYLSQTPLPEGPYGYLRNSESWEQVNSTIDLINSTSGKDYSRFKINPSSGGRVNLMGFRQKIGGIIGTLHADHFSDEPRPFSGSPSTVISQNQSQEQSVNVILVLQLQEKIIEKMNDKKTTEKERNFLRKVKEGLGGVKTGIETINLILTTAKAAGIDVSRLSELFQ